MSRRTSKAGRDPGGWLPTDPRQILVAVLLVLAVGASVAWVWRYQAMQPKPVPREKYEQMYRSMYGRQAAPPGAAEAPPRGAAAPPGTPGR